MAGAPADADSRRHAPGERHVTTTSVRSPVRPTRRRHLPCHRQHARQSSQAGGVVGNGAFYPSRTRTATSSLHEISRGQTFLDHAACTPSRRTLGALIPISLIALRSAISAHIALESGPKQSLRDCCAMVRAARRVGILGSRPNDPVRKGRQRGSLDVADLRPQSATERRPSRTDRAVGCTTALVLKTRPTGLGKSRVCG